MPNEVRVRLHLYGIRNCDSCRRALQWLKSHDADHEFHDLREEGLTRSLLDTWLASQLGPSLLNRRSTTWRQLPDEQKQLADRDPAALIVQHPTLIKRPVITDGDRILAVGFDPARLEAFI